MSGQLRKQLFNYIFIVAGSFIMAFGVAGFLSPNHITTGGTAGLAIVLHYAVNLPIGLLMVLINIPLIIVGWRFLGREFAIKTMLCVALITVFVEVLIRMIHLPAMSENLLLATMYGGVCIGIGLGLIFKGGASAGGGTIIAKIISRRGAVKPGTVILILDSTVVVSAALVFRNLELGLWSLISIYATTRLVDAILVGGQNQKIVHISSTKNLTELSTLISDKLGLSGTLVQGHDLHAGEYKDIIFLMVDRSRLNALKQLIHSYDENVKMIVMEATEVLGKQKVSA